MTAGRSRTAVRSTVALPVSMLAVVVVAASGCSAPGVQDAAATSVMVEQPPGVAPALSAAVVLVSPGDPALPARPDQPVTVQVADGRLTAVDVRTKDGATLEGTLTPDGARWTSSAALLDFGARYTVVAEAVDASGVTSRTTSALTVAQPQILTPSIGLSDGAVVGVGMPAIVRFDGPVNDRGAAERRLSVRTTPAVDGSWSWVSDREVHWRPQDYWATGTTVRVNADLEGARIGPEQWGGGSASRTFSVGTSNIYRVNVDTHMMDVLVGGKKVRTIPITTGKEGFLTRNGVKVVMSKERTRRMRSETVSIPEDSSEGYDITVDYAMRLTYSGEFIHAAPWSVGSQGRANVSHGCTGMSTADAKWLYTLSKPGDVVEYTGSPRPMSLGNGYGDWNVGWDAWLSGSASA